MNRNLYTTGSIYKGLWVLGWPVMLMHLLQTFYNLIDTFWLGKVGKVAIAAPTVSWPMIFVVISIAAGFAVAGQTLVSQYTGARDKRMADYSAAQVTILVLFIGTALGIIGFFITPALLNWMNVAAGVEEGATYYMKTIFLGVPLVFGSFVTASLLTGWGDTRTPLKILSVGVILNILMDPLLIFGLGPFPEMGVFGAAIATVFSRMVSSVLGFYLLFSGRIGLMIRVKDLKPDFVFLKKVIGIAIPASTGQVGTAIGYTVLMKFVAYFGTAVIDGYGIGNRVLSLATMPIFGFSRAVATMVGQNLGANNHVRTARVIRTGYIFAALITGIGAIIFMLFKVPLVKIFINNLDVIETGSKFFFIIGISLPFLGILMTSFGIFNAAGQTKFTMGISLLRLWGLRIPLIYLLSINMGMGYSSIYWIMTWTTIFTALLGLMFIKRGVWKRKVV